MTPQKHSNNAIIKSLLYVVCVCLSIVARGPDERSLMFNFTFGPGKHLSGFADEEKWFSKNFGFCVWKYNNEGNIDTTDLEYKYLDLALDVNASWYLTDILSFGTNYHFGNIKQSNKSDWENSSSLIELHRISLIISLWPMFRKRISFSGAFLIGPAFGNLHRFPLISDNYKSVDMMRIFLDIANKKVKCKGFSAGLRLNIHSFNKNSNGYLLISGSYDFALISIDNNLIVYPQRSINHEFGVRFGIGFCTKS
ncbi:MAG: hypothetical protein GX638_14195 [Crenarchaeota archaeon]|nr:hypothetical protein [Thermoproteota archaeon]